MVALVVIFVLMCVVIGLHYQQSAARAAFLREDAALQARQAVEFEVARHMSAASLADPPLEISAQGDWDADLPLPPQYASRLFTGLPDLARPVKVSWDPNLEALPGEDWGEISTKTTNLSLRSGVRRFRVVASRAFPYAAYAPEGGIRLERAAGWSNPTFAEAADTDASLAYSTVRALLGARDDVEVSQLPYGEVYSLKGKISVSLGTALAFSGYLPWTVRQGKTYQEFLFDEHLPQAYAALAARAQNKSDSVWGELPSFGDIFGLLSGSQSLESVLGSLLSLRQALSFPLPMIPGGSEYGVVTLIWLHMPCPPDSAAAMGSYQGPLKDLGEKQKAVTAELQKALARVEELKAKVASLQSQMVGLDPDSDAYKLLAQQLAQAQADLAQAQDEVQELKEQLEEISAQSDSILSGSLGGGSPTGGGPPTRADEETMGLGDEGPIGWSYAAVFSKILSIVKNLFSGDLKGLAESFKQDVRLVHFGPKNHLTEFAVSNGNWEMTATFNVPSGRALRLDGNVTIRGDLWIQRGASLHVRGNLTLVRPAGASTTDPLAPQGRLHLEEGATLLVDGDFRCQGGQRTGSVLVEGRVGGVHPVSSALLCQGNVVIPYGVVPAATLGGLGEEVAALKDLGDLLTRVAPNLAKIDGAFHRRKPYFARYATTFQIVKTPFPPYIIPTAVPLPDPKNCLVPIFGSLSMMYASQLNLILGENFLTMTDWWLLGQGVVPVVPKVNPAGLMGVLSGLSLPTLPSAGEVADYLVDYAKHVGLDMAKDLLSKVITALVKSQLGFPLSLVSGLVGDVVNTLTSWVQEIDKADTYAGNPTGLQLAQLRADLQNKLSGLQAAVLLAECPAPLIYAGKDLTVGAEAGQSPPVVVGFLASRGNLTSGALFTVGSMISYKGNITARTLLYCPAFTRASLYLPRDKPQAQPTGLGWLDWALEYRYGPEFDSGQAVDVGPDAPHLLVEGWDG